MRAKWWQSQKISKTSLGRDSLERGITYGKFPEIKGALTVTPVRAVFLQFKETGDIGPGECLARRHPPFHQMRAFHGGLLGVCGLALHGESIPAYFYRRMTAELQVYEIAGPRREKILPGTRRRALMTVPACLLCAWVSQGLERHAAQVHEIMRTGLVMSAYAEGKEGAFHVLDLPVFDPAYSAFHAAREMWAGDSTHSSHTNLRYDFPLLYAPERYNNVTRRLIFFIAC
jgi:hypothetical protein